MALKPGYNLVSEQIETTGAELGALGFFRRMSSDEDVDSRVTVTGLGELLYTVEDDERAQVIDRLRDTLRETNSLSGPQVVQFVFDGTLVDEEVLTVDIDGDRGKAYIPVGNLFVEEPKREGASHAVARK